MWALLPVKRIALGKSRLAAVLPPAQRAEFTCRMLQDVLRALRDARCVERILVVSNESRIDAALNAAGVERCPEEHEGDLNRSLMTAAAGLPPGVERVLILPADVPTVRAADIEVLDQALSRQHGAGVILCPAEVDGGTNALLSSLPLPFPLQFGEASLTRHLESARRHGVEAQVISRRGLARDMDRPSDLEWLADSADRGRSGSYLRRVWRCAKCEAT